jgi:integrase
MKNIREIIPLFKQFIKETQTGKRLKKNGERIKPSTIRNYENTLRNLIRFSADTKFDLRICNAYKLDKRELLTEKSYWKKFYHKFTEYLYKKNCHDNYVGSNIKIIRLFFNYLKNDKDLSTGNFQRLFYVRKEEIEILVLSPEQLKFLIHDKEFEQKLNPENRRIKDIFVFGCTTGLRYSDIFLLTNKNFELMNGALYLKLKSQKTKTFSYIKLAQYAVKIYHRYQPKNNQTTVFRKTCLDNFNSHLKKIGEQANFTAPIEVSREKQGKPHKITKKTNCPKNRFCDKMSSHMMRRTAITTLLLLGMPEHLVRKISGHSNASTTFNRYVHYAQAYIDKEIEKVHSELENY